MLRYASLLAVAVGCGSPRVELERLAQPPSEHVEPGIARSTGAWDLELDPVLGTVRQVRGAGIAFAAAGLGEAELERAALDFVRAHRDWFGTDELVADGVVADPTLVIIALAQRHRGLPVIGGHLGLAISHGRLVLAHGATYPVGELSIEPRIALAGALATVRDALAPAPHTGDRDAARLVVLPRRSPGAIAYALAWEITAWRGRDHAIAYVDAHGGELIAAHDGNRYDYTGTATHEVDERTVGDAMITLPASYLRLHSTSGFALTDAAGAFTFGGGARGIALGGAPALVVTADLSGPFVEVRNQGGDSAKFVGMMRPGRPYTLAWTEARSTPEERDVFRAVTTTNRYAAPVFPGLAWMGRRLVANVNLPRTCNAYWNGSSINFFTAGNGCNNTGRIFDVIAHEWGHGLDQHAPGGAMDGALGEFIGDLISFVQTGSPLIGPGFFTDGRAVRDLEDPAFECFDPSVREVHAAGQLLGAVVWDIERDLRAAGLTGEPLKRLLLLPVALAQTRRQWYAAMLAVDDDDGDLANGTPHECLIYNQFKAHSCGGTRWPGIPDRDPPHCAR